MDWHPSGDPAIWRERARLLHEVRAFFRTRGVLEVETPVLGRATVTDPAIDSLELSIDGGPWYLQTSPEYHMKRLLAAGAPSIYRLGPVFRAEETGPRHNPEFTMIEWYRLGFPLAELMTEVAALVDLILGPGSYRSVTYADLLLAELGVGVGAAAEELRRALAIEVSTDIDQRGLLDLAFTVAVERLGSGRFFITEYPADQAALAKTRANADGQLVAERFELVIDGIEIANGYDELTDAVVLSERMSVDREERLRAGRATPDPDERLVAAMMAGLPGCAGVALGFDRLVMLATGAARIEDVIAFPFSRA